MMKPFVSFIVMSYKAERFIQEAIDGALAQTYDNMEIIFSDDHSPDRTFEIIQENIKNYTGKHKANIRMFKNDKNMGIGAHLNKLWWEDAKGDWIVVSAGDDISLPNRVERMMEYATADVAIIHGKPLLIDEYSQIVTYNDTYQNVLNVFAKNNIEETIRSCICVRGATMCINKKMLVLFGTFNNDIVNEDVILAYRAQYYGKIIHLDIPFVKYREHSTSISSTFSIQSSKSKSQYYKDYISVVATESKNKIAIFNQVLKDNKLLKLSNSFLKEINTEIIKYKINYFLYGTFPIQFSFLAKPFFYLATTKRIMVFSFKIIKRNRKNI